MINASYDEPEYMPYGLGTFFQSLERVLTLVVSNESCCLLNVLQYFLIYVFGIIGSDYVYVALMAEKNIELHTNKLRYI